MLTLDSISVSLNGVNRVRDCKVWNQGIDSDHSALLLQLNLNLTSIKYKCSDSLALGSIDWHSIKNNQELNSHFNSTLKELLSAPTILTYTDFNKAILQAGSNTATNTDHVNQGWFVNDRMEMQPLIENKAELLHLLRNCSNPDNIPDLKLHLKLATKAVKD
jgi:hypothetical protein